MSVSKFHVCYTQCLPQTIFSLYLKAEVGIVRWLNGDRCLLLSLKIRVQFQRNNWFFQASSFIKNLSIFVTKLTFLCATPITWASQRMELRMFHSARRLRWRQPLTTLWENAFDTQDVRRYKQLLVYVPPLRALSCLIFRNVSVSH